jgi:predicted metal-dependent enzyme (double-stranded beta helix superfamily)
MAYTLEQFSADCHRTLTANPGPEGRKKVCELVQKACTDADFVRQHLPDDGPERKILYEDPQLGFCILGHVYHGAKQSAPHDHGPTWAIYGQAQGETIMTDWAMVSPASETQIGKVRQVRDYKLTQGNAYVYNEGDLHSPRREGSTKLIRIEGRNVEKIRRYPYEKAA